MWNNFQKVLEKRVREKGSFRQDKYFIQKIANQTILECFGKIGGENIVFEVFKQKNLFFKCPKSVWRNEMKLKEFFLLKQINLKMKEEGFFKRIILK